VGKYAFTLLVGKRREFGWCTTKLSIPLFFDAAIPFLELYSEATPSSYKNTT
jgi:hypothetical protein